MNNRLSTPDILGDIMSGSSTKEESNKETKQDNKKESKQSSNKPIKQAFIKAAAPTPPAITREAFSEESLHNSNKPEELKEKVTFGLPVSIVGELEDKWMEFRKLVGSKQVSRALLVEKALELAFEEFGLKKQESKFYSKVANSKEILE